MTATNPEHEIRSGRVFSRSPEASARRRLRPGPTTATDEAISDEVAAVIHQLDLENDRLQVEASELRTLIGQSIRVIEEQNARLREHGLEPVAPIQIRI
ncbi:MAG: hypothetical protein ACERLM_09580 [Acidimicrobiales bacterium]